MALGSMPSISIMVRMLSIIARMLQALQHAMSCFDQSLQSLFPLNCSKEIQLRFLTEKTMIEQGQALAEEQEQAPAAVKFFKDVIEYHSTINKLSLAAKLPKSWYLLFSQNAKAATNVNYNDILQSPRLLSNMIGMDPTIFSTQIFKGKKRKQTAIDFLKSEYNVHALRYRNIHQLIIFDSNLPDSWSPPIEDLLTDTLDANVTALAKQITRNKPSPLQLPPLATPQAYELREASSGIDAPIVSPTGSDSEATSKDPDLSNNSNVPTNFDFGATSGDLSDAVSKEIYIEDLVSQLIGLARFKGGTTVQEFEERRQYPWKEPNDSKKWSRQEYVKENCNNVVKPILHSYLQQDPEKLYQLVSLLISEDENVRKVFQQNFLEYMSSKTKKACGFGHIMESLKDPMKESLSTVDTAIVDSIREFLVALKSKGTRRVDEQQAVDAVITAVLFENVDEDVVNKSSIKKRLGITPQSITKAQSKVENMCKSSLQYDHTARAKRKDCKLDAARPYVDMFCHNQDEDRVNRNDTGDFQYYDIINERGRTEQHMRRRWDDCATKEDVFEKWKESRFAADFCNDYPDMETIGETVFWQLVCRCCRFGTLDQCSNLIMSGLEEARCAMEKVFKLNQNSFSLSSIF